MPTENARDTYFLASQRMSVVYIYGNRLSVSKYLATKPDTCLALEEVKHTKGYKGTRYILR